MDYRGTDGARHGIEPSYQSILGLTRVLLALLLAAAAVDVAAVISSSTQLALLRGDGNSADMSAGLYRENSLGGLAVALTIATLPVFAAWIVRAHRNLPSLGARNLDVTPAWAVAWFFIPFANLWKPYQAMRTLWRASQDASRWQLEQVPWWVTLWWIVWLARNALGSAMMMQEPSASAIEAQLRWTELNVTVQTVSLLLNGLAALLVLRIARAQSAQLRSLKAGPMERARPASRPWMA